MYLQQQPSLNNSQPAADKHLSELPAGHRPYWQSLRAVLYLIPALLIVACSSSGNNSAIDDAVDVQPSLADEQLLMTSGDENVSTPVEVLPQTEIQDDALAVAMTELEPAESDSNAPPVSNIASGTEVPSPVVELSPVELFLDEIGIAAASPLLSVNRKLQTGVALNAQESNCLDGFDAATGRTLTSINCAADENGNVEGVSIYNGEFEITQSRLTGTSNDVSAGLEVTNCEQSLSNNNADSCQLESAEILLPVKWVSVGDGTQPGPIASIAPIQGAAISYNRNADGLLIIQSVSDLFANFYCEIDIARASLTDAALSSGDCRQQVQRLINRFFESRTASDSDQDRDSNRNARQ